MTLQEFTNWSIAQGSVGKYQDGAYRGECVSLINQYAWRVLGVPADAWGNAKDWAYNATALRYFTKLPASTPLNRGDVLVYPATPTNPDGHIEIYLGNGQSLQQNRKLDRKTSVLPIWGGYFAVLRPKNYNEGVDMIPDQDNYYWRYGQDLAMRLRGRQLSRAEFRTHLVGQTGLRAIEILSDDPEATKAQQWQDVGRMAVTDGWQNQIYTLQAQLADAKKNVEAVLADSTASKAQLRDALARVVELENTPIIKEVPVYTHDEETKRMISSMYNYFVGQFKTFAKYIKK